MDFVADFQSAIQVMPAVASLDHPAASLETRVPLSFFFLSAARLDARDVPASRGRAMNFRVIVTFVVAQMLIRPFLRRRSRDDQGVQRVIELLHVVPVGAGERDGQGDAVEYGAVRYPGATVRARRLVRWKEGFDQGPQILEEFAESVPPFPFLIFRQTRGFLWRVGRKDGRKPPWGAHPL